MLRELATKGGIDQFRDRGFAVNLGQQQLLGKRVLRDQQPLQFEFRTGDHQYQTNMNCEDYISKDGYLPQRLITKGLNYLDQQLAGARKLPLAMVKKRPPPPVIDKRIGVEVDQYYRKIVRPRQTLLDSEEIALRQLQTANGINGQSMIQLPLAPTMNDMAYKQLQTQMIQGDMLKSVGNKPQMDFSQFSEIYKILNSDAVTQIVDVNSFIDENSAEQSESAAAPRFQIINSKKPFPQPTGEGYPYLGPLTYQQDTEYELDQNPVVIGPNQGYVGPYEFQDKSLSNNAEFISKPRDKSRLNLVQELQLDGLVKGSKPEWSQKLAGQVMNALRDEGQSAPDVNLARATQKEQLKTLLGPEAIDSQIELIDVEDAKYLDELENQSVATETDINQQSTIQYERNAPLNIQKMLQKEQEIEEMWQQRKKEESKEEQKEEEEEKGGVSFYEAKINGKARTLSKNAYAAFKADKISQNLLQKSQNSIVAESNGITLTVNDLLQSFKSEKDQSAWKAWFAQNGQLASFDNENKAMLETDPKKLVVAPNLFIAHSILVGGKSDLRAYKDISESQQGLFNDAIQKLIKSKQEPDQEKELLNAAENVGQKLRALITSNKRQLIKGATLLSLGILALTSGNIMSKVLPVNYNKPGQNHLELEMADFKNQLQNLKNIPLLDGKFERQQQALGMIYEQKSKIEKAFLTLEVIEMQLKGGAGKKGGILNRLDVDMEKELNDINDLLKEEEQKQQEKKEDGSDSNKSYYRLFLERLKEIWQLLKSSFNWTTERYKDARRAQQYANDVRDFGFGPAVVLKAADYFAGDT